MPAAAAAIGGAALGAGASIYAAKKAANAQKNAARRAEQTQMNMFNKQVALQEPFRQGGLTAQREIMALLGLQGDKNAPGFGSLAQSFGPEQFRADPGYAFRQAEGMKALERSAAARGGLLSGSALKGIERFGQDLASQEYGNAFNRYQIERAARLNPLQSLMGSGQSSANVLTGAAGQTGANVAQTQMAAGQARASGYVGSANALNQALGGISNYMQQQPLMNAMTQYYGGGGTPTMPSMGAASYGGATGMGTISIPASQRG